MRACRHPLLPPAGGAAGEGALGACLDLEGHLRGAEDFLEREATIFEGFLCI